MQQKNDDYRILWKIIIPIEINNQQINQIDLVDEKNDKLELIKRMKEGFDQNKAEQNLKKSILDLIESTDDLNLEAAISKEFDHSNHTFTTYSNKRNILEPFNTIYQTLLPYPLFGFKNNLCIQSSFSLINHLIEGQRNEELISHSFIKFYENSKKRNELQYLLTSLLYLFSINYRSSYLSNLLSPFILKTLVKKIFN